MPSRVLWRRSLTAAGLYASVGLGILGTIVAARKLGLEGFGLFATATAAAAFFQVLLDLTVEDALTKYGFRYVAGEDWGRLRRLFAVAIRAKLVGAVLATLVLAAFAPFADDLFDTEGLEGPMLAAALIPLVLWPENVATSALLLRGRYDLRGAYQTVSMGLRLVAIVLAAPHGVTATILAIVVAQAIAIVGVVVLGFASFRRFPSAPAAPLAEDRKPILAFVGQSSVATGMISLRTTLTPLLLGLAAGPTQVGLLRIAQAPMSGLSAASAPVRLILLTEQTRDWEHGRPTAVLAGVRRYMAGAAALMLVAAPLLFLAMPWLVETVFGEEYAGAVTAARIVLVAAAIQLVLGWTKSFPTTVGRPGLRIVAHGIETAVLLPLVLVLSVRDGVTGAAVAILVSTIVFAVVWVVLLRRVERETVAVAGTQPS